MQKSRLLVIPADSNRSFWKKCSILQLTLIYLGPVAHCPVRRAQDISVAGQMGLWFKQVLALCGSQCLLIRSHCLDAKYSSLLLPCWATRGWTFLPFSCPPSENQGIRNRKQTFTSTLRKRSETTRKRTSNLNSGFRYMLLILSPDYSSLLICPVLQYQPVTERCQFPDSSRHQVLCFYNA